MTSMVAWGLTKFAVPTATAVAPASMNSTASVPLEMPPMPRSGTFTALWHCHTQRRATGLMAGPEKPAKGRDVSVQRRSASMAMPMSVLMREMASAPADSAARAISAISVTLGVSLTMSGRAVA